MSNFDDIPLVPQPENLNINLYKHQLASIYQMEKRETDKKIVTDNKIIETNIGINTDITGYGKCHAKHTPILMFDGTIKPVQDITHGDLVMGDDSTEREVLSLVSGNDMMYNIVQSDAADYIVNSHHILSLVISKTKYMTLQNKLYFCFFIDRNTITYNCKTFKTNEEAVAFYNSVDINPIVDISIRNFLKLPKESQKLLKGYRVGVQYPYRETVNPYIFGLWLCYRKEYIKLHKDVAWFVKYNIPQVCMFENSGKYTFKDVHNKNIFSDMENIVDIILKPHIPQNMMINSRKVRLSLLAGIIDSCATFSNNVYSINMPHRQLINDIKTLCASLCIRTKFYCTTKKSFSYTKQYYRLDIFGNIQDIPSRLYTPVNVKAEKYIMTDIRVIKLIRDNYYGFNVNGNNRYLMGDYTVTHNSLAFVGMILRNKMPWDLTTHYEHTRYREKSGGRIRIKFVNKYDKLDTNLIIASQSIIKQWEDEFSHCDLRVKCITKRKEADSTIPQDYDVVIITPTMFNRFVERFTHYCWKRFIFDEPGHVRIPAMRTVMAGFYWFITATPNLIMNMHKNARDSFMNEILDARDLYWYRFDHVFRHNIVKCDPDFIKESFQMPETIYKYYECYQPLYTTVRGLVNENILTMISAGDINSAVRSLGGTNTNDIIELIKRKKNEEIEQINAKINIYNIREDTERVQYWSGKKEEVVQELLTLQTRISETLKDNCTICYDVFNSPTLLDCGHMFCGGCLIRWMNSNNTCPMCRKTIDTTKMICVGEEQIVERPKTKNEVLTEIIEGKPEGKFIIFSSYDETFNSIRNCLENKNINFSELRHTSKCRENTLKKFKNGNLNVIFLNSNNNGSGINLQEVTDIILYHEMDENLQTQILGRANRIGRSINLTVHQFKN